MNLISKFNNLKNEEKIEILLAALSYMQSYNGRSREDCIKLSMRDYLNLESSDQEVLND